MPRVKASDVFAIDWENLDEVKALAYKFGRGQIVIKYPWRKNYNIAHAEHEERCIFEGAEVVWRT